MSAFRPGDVDYERQAPNYSRGRTLTERSQESWREAVTRWFGPLHPKRILDLGSGTGRFSPLLAEWLTCEVIGVEPSDGMREAATQENPHPSVTYVAGNGGAIPLEDTAVDAAWY